MKEKRLLKALGQVDADYIEEASPTQQAKRLSAPVIKCKKTPRKKCSFVAEEAKKR